MKKIIFFIFFIFFQNIAIAELYELEIDVNSSEKITKNILIKNGYSSKCSAYLEESNESVNLEINFYGYSNKIRMDIILMLNEYSQGNMRFGYEAKINQNGTLGKKKFTGMELNGSSEFKKEVEPYVNVFKNIGDLMLDEGGYYPEYGKPLKAIPEKIDGKKLFKKMVKLLLKTMPDQSKELRKLFSHLMKNSDIKITKEFIGYTEIVNQRYNLIEYRFKIDYYGDKPEFREVTNEFNLHQIAFFHESGMPTIVYDIIPYNETPIHHSMICKVYDNNILISEISVPMLKDLSKLKKTTDNLNDKDFVDQLNKLNDLYKSGVLTEEEFEKAKKRILN